MAVEKLKLSEDLAWTYFEFFDALQEPNQYERQIKADQRKTQDLRHVLRLIFLNYALERLKNRAGVGRP